MNGESTTDFTQMPSYQRMVQRLLRIRPEQRAILNTLSADQQFADDQARKELASMTQRANTDYANKSLALKERAINTDMGLRRDAFDYGTKQDRMTTGIGLGQFAAETHFGKQREGLELALLKKKMGFMNRLEGLYGGA